MNEEKLNQFLGKMISDVGAAASGALIVIGDRLGLYTAIAENGPLTAAELAKQTNTAPRYIEEWLANQAASGYVEYDPKQQKFFLSDEQKAVFADENSPFLMTGGYYSIASVYNDEKKVSEAFRSGQGFAWSDHHECLFCGTAKFFRPSYHNNLLQQWLPSLDGVTERLKNGITVADVGCGYGHSTMIMAEAFPKSTFLGFDVHKPSIDKANALAKEAGLKNIKFEVSSAQEFPGSGYGLVTFFDCLHDMGDPVGAASHVKAALAPEGTWMVVEPFSHDEFAENLNPVGRVYYAFSATVCVPNALSQKGGYALGTQAGEKKTGEVMKKGGFSRFKRATETPFNIIYEVRP